MLVDGKSFAVAENSGKYSAELGSIYSKEARQACRNVERQEYKGIETKLHALAKHSAIRKAASVAAEFLYPGPPVQQHLRVHDPVAE